MKKKNMSGGKAMGKVITSVRGKQVVRKMIDVTKVQVDPSGIYKKMKRESF